MIGTIISNGSKECSEYDAVRTQCNFILGCLFKSSFPKCYVIVATYILGRVTIAI